MSDAARYDILLRRSIACILHKLKEAILANQESLSSKSKICLHSYHHSTGPSPDCIIEAWKCKHLLDIGKLSTNCNAVRTLSFGCDFTAALGRSYRSEVMPMLVLYADAYPFELVIEVFISFVNPRPNLFLHITVIVVSFTASILQNKSIRYTDSTSELLRGP